MTIFSTSETIHEAIDTFYLDRPGKPELVPLGLPAIDEELGGLGPGACGILAAATGVGKSSTMLAAMLNSKVKVGAVSVEDTPDVIGTRILSALTGIDSLRIRRKDLTEAELKKINKSAKSNKLDQMYFSYPIAGSIEQVEESITELTQAGCRMIWIDYLQEIRGHGKGDRRNEVSEAMTRCHRAAAAGNAALMAISQFRRMVDKERVPTIHHLKESGDLENKSRIILLCYKHPDSGRIRFSVGKSTYGGEHIKFDYKRDESGTLRPVSFLDYAEDEDF